MPHVSTQVRDVVAARLLDATPIANVSTNRGVDLNFEELPAAVVGTPAFEVIRETKPKGETGALYRRLIELTVVIVNEGTSSEDASTETAGGGAIETVDVEADELMSVVEAALETDETLGGIAQHFTFQGSDMETVSDENGDRWYVINALAWTVEVWTERGEPDVAL